MVSNQNVNNMKISVNDLQIILSGLPSIEDCSLNHLEREIGLVNEDGSLTGKKYPLYFCKEHPIEQGTWHLIVPDNPNHLEFRRKK
jgi:hypothetical protein